MWMSLKTGLSRLESGGVPGLVWSLTSQVFCANVHRREGQRPACHSGLRKAQTTAYPALNTGSSDGLSPVYSTYASPGPALWYVPCSFMPSCPGWILVCTLAFYPPWGRHTPNSNLVMECGGRPRVDACIRQQNNIQCRIDFWNVLWGSWPWTWVLPHSLQLLL